MLLAEAAFGVLGVAGMNYSSLLERSVDFDPFFDIMKVNYPNAVDRVVGLQLIQMLWDRGENDGYATHRVILLRSEQASEDLVTHELCHVWQMQHRPLRMPLSYLGTGYAANQYERQARAAGPIAQTIARSHHLTDNLPGSQISHQALGAGVTEGAVKRASNLA